ncbi:putative transketolase C-terminal section [Propionispora sp. 2/2-37]|uniref:transketolase family protein n=1 Tax=Propionispora sp. 2/2-37 TaxID=1677858 RepID=UPI0006BB8BA3|nr:transketolase family protein [Propionispora sp. 2/2-37]CUH97778.1 putative transketolase C-terminal section [Propionispora sp. 2/2-37]
MSTAMRNVYGQVLAELKEDPRIVVLDADLGKATKVIEFKKACPERFFDMGIAEQDMIGTAAGFAACGKIPFASTFAIFATGRAFEQIRNSVAYPKLNVKIAATHAGVTVGYDGGSHQSVEDIALMRSVPNMVVLSPADAVETRQAIYAAIEHVGPVYLRISRIAVPDIHDETYQFTIGKGEMLREGNDVSIIATGIMVSKALAAAEQLAKEGIHAAVVNIPTIKPIDKELIIKTASITGKVVTAEEHSVIGGLGSAVCEVLSQAQPTKIKLIGIQDRFGCSGSPDELLQEYKLTTDDIIAAVKAF